MRFSLAGYVMDQRIGDDRFSGWFENHRVQFRVILISRIFEMLASALNKIIQNSHFRRRSVSRNRKPQKRIGFFEEDRSPSWSSTTLSHSKVTRAHDIVIDYADLFSVTHPNDNFQEFDTRSDENLLSMTKIPSDDILESLYKLRIHESDQLKTVFAGAVVTSRNGLSGKERGKGTCCQWKAKGQCSRGDQCKHLKWQQQKSWTLYQGFQDVQEKHTILELTGKIQELQNEINCMNDSRDSKDAESVRSGLSHVTSQPALLPPFPDPGGMLSRSVGMLSRNDKPPDIWDTHGNSGNVFVIPPASSSSPYPHGFNPWTSVTSEHTSPQVMSERQTPDTALDPRCQSGPSARTSFDPSERRSPKDYGADQQRLQISDLHFWQTLQPSNICLLEDKIQDCGMYLFTISSYGSYAVDQRNGDGWISGWSQIFAFYRRNSWAKLWVTRRENCFSTEQNHPEYPLQEKGQSEGTKSPKRGPFPSWKTDRLPDLRVLPGHWSQWSCRELCRPIYSCSSKWWYSGIRFKMGRNSIVDDANPIWWHLGKLVQIKNTRVWETQDRIGIVQYGDSSVESWLKTMVKRSIQQNLRMKNFEARNGNYETCALVKNQGTKQREQRSLGDCWQWKANGQCSKGDNCSSRHDMNKRAKSTQPNPSPRHSTQQRNPNAPKFEDRSQVETEWQERCARDAAWRLAKKIQKLKEKHKTAFFHTFGKLVSTCAINPLNQRQENLL